MAIGTASLMSAVILGGAASLVTVYAHHIDSTTPIPTSGVVGTALKDSALMNADVSKDRQVRFHLYPPGDTCVVGTDVFNETDALAKDGVSTVTTTGSYVATQVGTYNWTAEILLPKPSTTIESGPSACGQEPVVITKKTSSVATTPGSTSATVPSTLSDTATVTGVNPTGTVHFTLYGPTDDANACTGTKNVDVDATLTGGGAASPTFKASAPGRYDWVVTYSGDAGNSTSSSACGTEKVRLDKANPTITTVPDSGVAVGNPIKDTAQVTGNVTPPAGTVVFSLYGPEGTGQADLECQGQPLFTSTKTLDSQGKATSDSVTPTQAGEYDWVASYQANAGNNAATSACSAEPVTIDLRQPQIATTQSAGGTVGIGLTDTAAVSGGYNPTGLVTFSLYPPSNPTCDPEVGAVYTHSENLGNLTATGGSAASGSAYTSAAVGTYRWVVSYAGDVNNKGITSPCTAETVTTTKAGPQLATTQTAGGVVGIVVSDAATLSGNAPLDGTGSVTFTLYGPNDEECSGTPAYSHTVSGMTGTVTNSGGFTTLLAGKYEWVASFSGDSHNVAAHSVCGSEPVTIDKASPSVATTPSGGGTVGVVISDTATVSGGSGPTGTVTFNLYGVNDTACALPPVFTDIASLSGSKAASKPYTTAAAGTFSWIASYSGDTNNLAASGTCSQEQVTVTKATMSIVTTASSGGAPGTAVSDSATLSGGFNPTGTVTFHLYGPTDTTCVATPVFTSTVGLNGNGAKSESTTNTGIAGTYNWTATYNGDSNNGALTSACGTEPVKITATGGELGLTTGPSAPNTGSDVRWGMGLGLLVMGAGVLVAAGVEVQYRRRRTAA